MVVAVAATGLTAEAALVAHYRLDDLSTAGAIEDSVGAHDGAVINAARVTPGVPLQFGTSFDFQPGGGQGGGINLGTSAAVRPADDFTMTFRFNADTLDQFDRLIESMDGTTPTSRGFRIDLGSSPGDSVRALLRDGSGSSNNVQHSSNVAPGEWNFVAVRFDKDDKLQLTVIPETASLGGSVVPDNSQSQGAVVGPLVYQPGRPTVLGVETSGGAANNAFDGRLDDVAFYNSVLGDDEVKFVRRFGAQTALPTLAFDGADPGASPADNWKPNLGSGTQWNLSGGPDEPALTSGYETGSRILAAYEFTGGNGKAQAGTKLPSRGQDLTVETWIRPVDFSGQEIIFEAGGDGNGFSLLLDDTTLRFRMDQDVVLPGSDHLEASVALPSDLLSDFFQVAGTIDLAGNAIELFVNGFSVASDSTGVDITSWAGGNDDALGSSNASGTSIGGSDSGDLDPYGSFDGLIGLVRLYHGQLLSGDQLRDNYTAMFPVPEPTTLLIWSLLAGLGVGLRWRRRK